MDQPKEHILQFFAYAHLPPHLANISRPFCELAHAIAETVRRVAARPPEWFDETGRSAVAAFGAQREAFREAFAREVMA